MKKISLTVIALVAISMLAPNLASAEPTHFNEIGLYTTMDGYGDTGIEGIGIPLEVYLVLTKPAYNGTPNSGVKAFECQLNFNPIGNMFKLGDYLLANGLNIGDTDHIGDGYLEYIVGFSEDLPAVNEAVALIEFVFMNLNQGPVEVTLGPVSTPSIPGQIVFVPAGITELEIMYQVSGHPDAPVFIFNGMAIPVESESFGSVKALYR